MKVRFNRWYNAVLTALLSMLGFEACESVDEYGAPPVEYGTPYARYEVKGQVADEAGNPIQGIQISAASGVFDSQLYQSVTSDATGHYTLSERQLFIGDDDRIEFKDVDGEAHGGLFQDTTLNMRDMPMEKTANGDNHWNSGTFKVNGNVKLKKK